MALIRPPPPDLVPADETVQLHLNDLASPGRREACLHQLQAGALPARHRADLLGWLIAQDRFEDFEAVCRAVGRRWAPTSPQLNKAIATRALEGDQRWIVSLFQHRLTQHDHGTGTATVSQAQHAWLRMLVDMAPGIEGGWDNLLATMQKVPTGWSGAFGGVLLKNTTPDNVQAALRGVENMQTVHRQWKEGKHPIPPTPGVDSWQSSSTPLTHWTAVVLDRLMGRKDQMASVLRDARHEVRHMVQQGADAGAWERGCPAIVEMAQVETFVHAHDPSLVPLVVELFDILAPTVEWQARGSELSGGHWWQSACMDIPSGLASYGAVALARRAIEHGARPGVDRYGRTWEWHAWARGRVDVDIPETQLTRRDELGKSLLALLIKEPRSEQDPVELAGAMRRLLAAGLTLKERLGDVPLREAAMAKGGVAAQAMVELDALLLGEATPATPKGRSAPRL